MRAIALGLLLCLAACRQEPDFEERYSQAENRIAERASALDAELNLSAADNGAGEDADLK